ncbi:cellulase family glycosylhydrolase [Corallococcus macrosporus]|uniref:Cellulase family glycosylhydrolase n=1 Tax=Corallococcus macrosporus TaxID=35 RepID=A0ABS3DPW7_9BACT|nr:cellulase family glycosylhydrolase [Corallococcus macrosporus]MBN8233303.1 cellulase family glycosylhydrolase [Corallococcus macrosporus]
MTQKARSGFLLSVALLLLALPLSASALTFVNRGASTAPRTVSAGQTVQFTLAMQSPEAVSGVTVSFQVRRYSADGIISPSAVYTKTVTGQAFAAGESRQYTWGYVIPATLVTGDYAWVTRATNASGTVVYLDVAKTVSNYTFHVDGVPEKRFVRGINIMDLGNAGGVLPGTYGTTYPKTSLESLQQLKARGHTVVRVPFIWERLQPVPGGALNTAYLGYLMETLEHAKTAGLGVIVDMHNYARFTSGGVQRPFGGAGAPTEAQYADAWRRISAAIRASPAAYSAVYAYDLMNEPHDLPYVEGTFSNPVAFASFEAGVEGWVGRDTTNTTVSRVVRNNQGSLKVTTPAIANASTVVLGARVVATVKRAASSDGPTFQAKVFVPTTTPGSAVRARMVMIDSAYKTRYGEPFAVTQGVDTRVYFKPPADAWTNNQGVSVEFIVDGNDGSAPFVFYVDHVAQGTQSGEAWPARVWEKYSQAAVSALRDAGDGKLLMVEGYSYSSAERWPENHPQKWVSDPMNNIMYHAHIYFDDAYNGGGKYDASHAVELTHAKSLGYATVGQLSIARVKKFTDWVAAQGTQGFIGEYGWPNSATQPGDAAAWNADGEEFLRFLDTVGMGATMWVTGTWERLPDLNVNAAYQLTPTFVPLSQAPVLEAHPGNP